MTWAPRRVRLAPSGWPLRRTLLAPRVTQLTCVWLAVQVGAVAVRLAIARMIGGDESSHDAHLALIELANRICGPAVPDCGHCPLRPWCDAASDLPVQGVLAVT